MRRMKSEACRKIKPGVNQQVEIVWEMCETQKQVYGNKAALKSLLPLCLLSRILFNSARHESNFK